MKSTVWVAPCGYIAPVNRKCIRATLFFQLVPELVYATVKNDSRYTAERNTLGLLEPVTAKRIEEVRFAQPPLPDARPPKGEKAKKKEEKEKPKPKQKKQRKDSGSEDTVSESEEAGIFFSFFLFVNF